MQGRDLNLDIKRVVAYRHWCNKLWNAIRFALLNLGKGFAPSPGFPGEGFRELPLPCRWILSRLAATAEDTVNGFQQYQFGDAVQVNRCTFRRSQRRAVFSPQIHACILSAEVLASRLAPFFCCLSITMRTRLHMRIDIEKTLYRLVWS